MRKPFIIGIVGGSGSGKTTLARELCRYWGVNCVSLYQDSYYLDQSKNFDHDGGRVNFDHPDTLEFPLLAKHLAALKEGMPIDVPIYDFKTHSRRQECEKLSGCDIVLLDGILILSQPEIVKLLDFSVFVDTPEKDRYARRLKRDVTERGRSPEGVEAQFNKQVKPMHDLYVEPSKAKADMVVSGLRPIAELKDEVLARVSEKFKI